MAIEITPKPASKLSALLNDLFYFSLVLVLISISIFFVLNYYQNKASKTLQDLETTLIKGKTQQDVVLEKEILGYQKKINDFSSLIVSHKNIPKFFSVFEKIAHPKVEFTKFILNAENFRLILSGKTGSFQFVDQQILIFKKENLIKDFTLSKLFIDKDGKVEFSFDILLNRQIFK
jgi:hypothetical protein